MQNVHKHVETRHEKKKNKNINILNIFITKIIRYGADNLQFYPSGKTTII